MMVECDWFNHTAPAKYKPVFLMWPPLKNFDGAPSEGETSLKLCEDCRQTRTAEDLMNDEGWKRIVSAHVAGGKLPPDRATMELDWRKLTAP